MPNALFLLQGFKLLQFPWKGIILDAASFKLLKRTGPLPQIGLRKCEVSRPWAPMEQRDSGVMTEGGETGRAVIVASGTTLLCNDVSVAHGEARRLSWLPDKSVSPSPLGLAPPAWARLTATCCPERPRGGGSCRNAEEGATGRPARLTLEKKVTRGPSLCLNL